MLAGKASMNSVKRFPVPSIPGNNTSLARALDTELMLAGVLVLVVHEKRGYALARRARGNLLKSEPFRLS
jgi:hypothetical protein